VGLIIVPQGSEEMKLCFAEVVAVGPDCIETEVGDIVQFGRYGGMIVNAKEAALFGISIDPAKEELQIMREEDVLCDVVDADVPLKEAANG
jgi:co-chaperonin GroES (HSP10)